MAPPKRTSSDRILALDFTKGALVLIMVLYHWINYFIGFDWPYYRYLRFLTPSFIFVSGFLISNVYLSRYNIADRQLSKRLLTRGLKLLAIFVILNAARAVLFAKSHPGIAAGYELDSKTLATIFLTGNTLTATSKTVAFYILVPISYLLLLSAVLIFPYKLCKHTFHLVCAIFLCGILALDLKGFQSSNLEFVTVGLLGLLAGFLPIDRINRMVGHRFALAVSYACYLGAITVWNVPFLLLCVGACLSVAAIYVLGLTENEPVRARGNVILLGKYSLFGYISQIAILQLLSAGFRHVHIGDFVLGISFLAAFGLTMLSVEAVDQLRKKSTIASVLDRAVFA